MDLETFEDLLDRHGGDLAAWPASLREAASSYVQAAPAAAAALKDLVEIEASLRRPLVGTGLSVDLVASRAMRHPQSTRVRLLATRAGWGTAAAAVLVAGILVGALAPNSSSANADRVLAASAEPGDVVDVE